MYWIYILKSTVNGKFYIGYSDNIKKRFHEHNSGLSRATKRYLPWKLVYLEGYANIENAKEREQKLKQFGRVYAQLKRRIAKSLGS